MDQDAYDIAVAGLSLPRGSGDEDLGGARHLLEVLAAACRDGHKTIGEPIALVSREELAAGIGRTKGHVSRLIAALRGVGFIATICHMDAKHAYQVTPAGEMFLRMEQEGLGQNHARRLGKNARAQLARAARAYGARGERLGRAPRAPSQNAPFKAIAVQMQQQQTADCEGDVEPRLHVPLAAAAVPISEDTELRRSAVDALRRYVAKGLSEDTIENLVSERRHHQLSAAEHHQLCIDAATYFGEIVERDQRRGRPDHHDVAFLIHCIRKPIRAGFLDADGGRSWPEDAKAAKVEKRRLRKEAEQSRASMEKRLQESKDWLAVDDDTRGRIERDLVDSYPELAPDSREFLSRCLDVWRDEERELARAKALEGEAKRQKKLEFERAAETHWDRMDAADRERMRECVLGQVDHSVRGRMSDSMLDTMCRSRARALYIAEDNKALWDSFPEHIRERAVLAAINEYPLFRVLAAINEYPLFRDQVPYWTAFCLMQVPKDLWPASER